jgi:hypothetical protein
MADPNGGIIAANGVTTGTSHLNRKEVAKNVAAIAVMLAPVLPTIDLEEMAWWSREVLTGFPDFRHKFMRGWNRHKSEYL